MPEQPPGEDFQSQTSATFRSAGAGSAPVHAEGTFIGSFRILGLLGQGGMGTVYRAEQERPNREVALKLVRAGMASGEVLRRFETETEVLGRLRHPGIAQIYEVGMFEGDFGEQPFFAMELVEGQSLTEAAHDRGLTLEQRLGLFAEICDAVQHAHQKGVIHRDLKPANLMVNLEGHAKILDFGVARATDSDLQATMQTDVGQLVGTLAYMSPEQVEADPGELDTRSDVYSLGVVLYELVSGHLPYEVHSAHVLEAARIIREREPTRLSSRSSKFRGDLETITFKALEKDKERRYPTASDLGADVRRYLADEPIVARPASRLYQLQKFARRNKGLVGGLVCSFVILLVATIVSLRLAVVASREREAAVTARQELERVARAQTELAQEEARQRRLAEEARAQTETVAAFQSKMLQDIDAFSMGNRILGLLRQEIHRVQESMKVGPNELASTLAAFEGAIQGVNRTEIASALLDRTFLDPAASAAGEQFADQPELELALRRTLGEIFMNIGLFFKGEEQFERALALSRLTEPADPSVEQRQLLELAEAHIFTGKYGEVEGLLGSVLSDEQPDRERLRLRARDLLGRTHLLQGSLDEARALLEPTMERQVALLGDGHLETQATMTDLAMVYSDSNNLDQAEALFHRILAAQTDDGSLIDARRRLSVEASLAWNYVEQERLEESIELGLKILEERRRLFGESHPDSLQSENNLAVAYRKQGRYDLAEPLYRHDLETTVEIFGREHPEVLATMSNFGRFLVETGQLEEAKTHLEETIALHDKVMPPGFFAKGYTYQTYAVCLRDMKRYPEARAALEKAYELLLPALGPEDRSINWTVLRMIEIYESEGNEAGAEEWRKKLPGD